MDTMYKVNCLIENAYSVICYNNAELMCNGFIYEGYITVKYNYTLGCVLYSFLSDSTYAGYRPMFGIRPAYAMKILESLYNTSSNGGCITIKGHIKFCSVLEKIYKSMCNVNGKKMKSFTVPDSIAKKDMEHYENIIEESPFNTYYMNWLFDRVSEQLEYYDNRLKD